MSLRVVIIDDDQDDADILCQAISSIDRSHQCIEYDDPREALAALQSSILDTPDLIFLDSAMPRLSGKEFLRILITDPQLSKIPVVIFSDYLHQIPARVWVSEGAFKAIPKGFTFEGIVSSVNTVFASAFRYAKKRPTLT